MVNPVNRGLYPFKSAWSKTELLSSESGPRVWTRRIIGKKVLAATRFRKIRKAAWFTVSHPPDHPMSEMRRPDRLFEESIVSGSVAEDKEDPGFMLLLGLYGSSSKIYLIDPVDNDIGIEPVSPVSSTGSQSGDLCRKRRRIKSKKKKLRRRYHYIYMLSKFRKI